MKFLHLSDLHLGKRLNAFSLLEDQQYMLSQLCDIVEREQTDAVILAGDIYDKAVPSAEAVQLFDHFCPVWYSCIRTFCSSAATMILRSALPLALL